MRRDNGSFQQDAALARQAARALVVYYSTAPGISTSLKALLATAAALLQQAAKDYDIVAQLEQREVTAQ
jgi:hypothetical protein